MGTERYAKGDFTISKRTCRGNQKAGLPSEQGRWSSLMLDLAQFLRGHDGSAVHVGCRAVRILLGGVREHIRAVLQFDTAQKSRLRIRDLQHGSMFPANLCWMFEVIHDGAICESRRDRRFAMQDFTADPRGFEKRFGILTIGREIARQAHEEEGLSCFFEQVQFGELLGRHVVCRKCWDD